MAPEQFDSSPLSDRAYRYLEEQIVTMQMQPGDLVVDTTVAATLSISRTPVREALIRLQREGLVEVQVRRGIFVTSIHLPDHMDLLATRRALDEVLLRSASKRAEVRHLEELDQCAAAMRLAAGQDDTDAFMREDRQFDQIVFKAARNRSATSAVLPLHTHCRRFWYAYRNAGDLNQSAEFHTAVMDALVSRDADLAVQHNNQLIEYLADLLRRAVAG